MRIALMLLLLAGCASNPFIQPQEVYAPDGKPALLANCTLQTRCHAMARDTCGGAYLPLSEGIGSHVSGTTTPKGYGNIQGGSVYSLTFRCQEKGPA